ncbi:unnamed protein product [Absidia cylindrospora]
MDFKLQLDSFLKLFEFCQDVLTRCPNADISLTLLQSIRTFFLQNILYPSILECSDIDGSSVAVITYIDLILQTLQQEDLADVVVKFLMDEESGHDNTLASAKMNPSSTGEAATENGSDDINNKQHSNVFAGIEFDQFKSSPYFTASERFTLKDLILSRLKSSSQPTVIATLKLLKTLITKHCRYSLKLLNIYPDISHSPFPSDHTSNSTSSTIVSHHIKEIELYFSLITGIDQTHSSDILSVGYEEYLDDIEFQMEADWCYQNMVNMDGVKAGTQQTSTPKAERRRSFKYGKRPDEKDQHMGKQNKQRHSLCSAKAHLFRHRIRPTDPLLQILLGLLSHFFAQSSALNLALTGVISALALCPYRSLEGWISFQESDRTTPDDILILDSSNITNGTTTTTNTATTSSSPSTFASSTTDNLQRLHLEDRNGDKIRGSDIYAHFDYNKVNEDDEDDDRSVDFGVERNLSHTATTTQFKRFPPFFTLFQTLTQQVDCYRSEVDDFDDLLQERWQSLMFGTVDASISATSGTATTTLGSGSMGMTAGTSLLSWTSSSPGANRRGSSMRQDTQPSSSSLFLGSSASNSIDTGNNGNTMNGTLMGEPGSMLSGRRPSVLRSPPASASFGHSSTGASTLFHQQQQQYHQQQKRRPSILPTSSSISSNAAGHHHHHQRLPPNPSKSLSSSTTAAAMAAATRITPTPLSPPTPTTTTGNGINGVNAEAIPPVLNNPLSPLAIHARKTLNAKIQPLFPSNFIIEPEEPILDLDEDDEDTFAPKDTNPSQSRRLDKSTEITLSMLLNNAVILEETIKELVAIMQVRRSNGIDRISYF